MVNRDAKVLRCGAQTGPNSELDSPRFLDFSAIQFVEGKHHVRQTENNSAGATLRPRVDVASDSPTAPGATWRKSGQSNFKSRQRVVHRDAAARVRQKWRRSAHY